MRNINLTISFLFVAVLTIAVGGVGIFGMMRISESGLYIKERITEPMPQLAFTERTLLTIRLHVREMVMASLKGDFELVETEFGNIVSLLPVMDKHMDAYRGLIDDPEVKRLFDEARALYENYLVPTVVSIYEASLIADVSAITSAMEYCRYYSERILDDFAQSFELLIYHAQAATLHATNMAQTLLIMIIIVLFVSVATTVLLAFYISGMIKKPIKYLTSALEDVANGDLTKRLAEGGLSEVAQASRHYNKTMEELKIMIAMIKSQSEKLFDGGNVLADNMNQTAVAINEITANINTVKGRVINQSASVSETHATMEQVVVNINKLNNHVEKQSGNVSMASAAIEQMVANTRSVTETLFKNATNVKALKAASDVGRNGLSEVSSDIQEIARESEGLMEINLVIENIASQTNLLSMNAAIEAAHAGNAGKGFAVVADEIRKLAENSSEQSKIINTVLKKIKESIEKITRSTGNVLNKFEAIDESVRTVAEQEENILLAMEEQGVGSKQILEKMDNLNEITRQVKNGTHEMLESAKEVIKESENLEKATQEIAYGMNEMATGTEKINKSVNHVTDLSGKNSDGITVLIKEVSRFRVNSR
ncbi:MAG: methyl-accepting chemotaxis protein [Treponema sp.]|jgi:methyl-accepting chemotaxis protein|nr:methyl-accepting chemotaxis protein [Treponema sp.]